MTTAAKPLIANLAPPAPTVGRVVHFQTDERGGKRYVLPAIITCVEDSHPDHGRTNPSKSDPSGVWFDDNPVPVPYGTNVHLHVMSPGPAGAYTELGVPFDDSAEPAPRSWHWPPRA